MRDPRVRRRIERVVQWALPYVANSAAHGLGPFEFRAADLRKVFGNVSSNPLSGWLYANLMRQTGHYRVHEYSFSYEFKVEGLEKVLRLMAEKPQHNI